MRYVVERKSEPKWNSRGAQKVKARFELERNTATVLENVCPLRNRTLTKNEEEVLPSACRLFYTLAGFYLL